MKQDRQGYYRVNSMRVTKRFWSWWFDYGCAHCHAEVFMYLVRMSEAKNTGRTMRQEPIETNLSDLSRRCGLNWRTIRDDLEALEKADFIRTDRDGKSLRIVVCNLLQYVAMKERKDKRKKNPSDTLLKKENIEKKESAGSMFFAQSAEKDTDSFISPLSLEDRRNAFWQDVCRVGAKYGEETCKAFFLFWAEPSTDGTKMRWEMQRTWSVGARLARWRPAEAMGGNGVHSTRLKRGGPPQTDAQRAAERAATDERLRTQAEEAVPLWAYQRVVSEGLYKDGMRAKDVLATCEQLAVCKKLNTDELGYLQEWRKRHKMLQKEHQRPDGE